MAIEELNFKEAHYDPVTAEVIQMRLYNVVKEMATTITRTSGSPILTEARDFSTAIFDEKGEHVAFSGYVIAHIGSSLVGVESVIRDYPREEIFPGDAFICNDPYTSGAIHQGDVGIISPLFYQNELVGWAFSNAHVLDVGGMSPGGWAPVAWDRYSEALAFPSIKIVEKGHFVKSVQKIMMNNVRLPAPVFNDIKSLVAANIVAQKRLNEVIDRYGLDDYKLYCEVNKKLTEKALRERLEKIPDGTYTGFDWSEYDGHGQDNIVRLKATVEKKGSDLYVDFTGTDPQSDGFINAGPGAMVGIQACIVMMFLAYDLPINAGILRPIHLNFGPSGTVTNPVIPAPVSCGHMEGGARAGRLLGHILYRLFQLSSDHLIQSRVGAMGHSAWPGNSWVGLDQTGNYTAFALTDCGSCGLGAQATGDGLDIAAMDAMLDNGIPDVEANEALYPILYLWRSLNTNSGGPGYNRGGQGMDFSVVPWGTENLMGTLENACAKVPSLGVAGGYPGGTSFFKIIRGAKAQEILSNGIKVPSLVDLQGEERTELNHVAAIPLGKNDVFRLITGAGGGVGDPLLREPERVAADVHDGYISLVVARAAYGVAIDPDTHKVDHAETESLRQNIRQNRLGKKLQRIPKVMKEFRPALILEEGALRCNHCGAELSTKGGNWRVRAVSKVSDLFERMTELELQIQPHAARTLVLREFFCPECASTLDVETVTKDMPILFDMQVG